MCCEVGRWRIPEPCSMAELHLQIVPALFAVGYSNDLLWHDPNLIEALPVRESLFVVLNWCDACQRRQLDAGALLADNVKTCIQVLREVNPGGSIYVWSDMFDPRHNAHKDYYLVRGDLTGSWAGLDKDVVIVNWNFDKRNESLKWFAERGHRQLMPAITTMARTKYAPGSTPRKVSMVCSV